MSLLSWHKKMEWFCQRIWNCRLIDTPQSPSLWLDHDLRAAMSPYFCHHFILKNFYLKGENNISFSCAILQFIGRSNHFYIFMCTNYFFRTFPHFLLDCLFIFSYWFIGVLHIVCLLILYLSYLLHLFSEYVSFNLICGCYFPMASSPLFSIGQVLLFSEFGASF